VKRKERNFSGRSKAEQEFMLENTWCGVCNAADLGLNKPFEYEEDEKIFVEGLCRMCGNRVVSEIKEKT